MIRTHWMTSSAAAKAYYRSSDYYATSPGEWLGKGAGMLGLEGNTSPEQFDSLADNLDPRTGMPLTAYTREGRRVGLDMTFNAMKSVSLARELAGPDNEGDPRIEAAHREAVKYTVGLIERDMQARVRVGGANENRTTGNLVAYRVTHRDTRINADDGKPDPQLHDHVFIFNATYDPEEKKWKAAEIGQIKHDAPYYEALYANRLAANLRTLGYGIRREGKAFEIAGIDRKLIEKFSRRTAYISKVAEKLGIAKPESMAKLGATTRLGKAKEVADDLNGYYVSRLTERERQQLTDLEGKPSYVSSETEAVRFAVGHLFERQSVVEERKLYETAIRHGIGSVTPEGVEEEAKRQGVLLKAGEATTRDVLAEESRIIAFAREGRGTMRPLRIDPSATVGRANVFSSTSHTDTATLPALGQQKGRPDESRRPDGVGPRSPVIPPLGRLRGTSFDVSASASSAASAGPDASDVSPTGKPTDHYAATLSSEQQADLVSRGSATNLAASQKQPDPRDNLSAEQQGVVRHVWDSPDQVILIRGAAGTGKTHTTKAIIAGIDRPYAMLAPTAEASRGVLRREGFEGADTVAAFLGNRDWQAKVRNGVLFVDEAGLLPIRDLSQLTDVARAQNARLVLMGDPKQHKSVARHGNMFRVLQEYAGLPVAELRDIRRQRGEYKQAVAAIDRGELVKAHDLLDDLGYIRQSQDNTPLVDDYVDAVRRGKSVLVVAPTHAEGDEITAAIRQRLKDEGKLGGQEVEFACLKAANLTEAERSEPSRIEGLVAQLHRATGTLRAGSRVRIDGERVSVLARCPRKFAAYVDSSLRLSAGDTIRATANIRDTAGKRIDNGSFLTVTGFSDAGIEVLTATGNYRTLSNDVGHIAHGYVSTSHAAQGKTVDVVLGAMGSESLPAINAEQFYVTASRGRERFTLYTNLSPDALREAIQQRDVRKSATELMGSREQRNRSNWLVRRAREFFHRLRASVDRATTRQQERELSYGR